MIELLKAIMNIVFIVFAVYGIFVLRKYRKVILKTDKMLEQMKKENGWN